MISPTPRRRAFARTARCNRGLAAVAACTVAASVLSGCALAPLLRASELKGSKDVQAKYTGLSGKTFAVVVAADRTLQASYPMLVGQITTTVSRRLAETVGASKWIPPELVLGFLSEHPEWTAWTMHRLATELGVDRVIFIDVQEFRLNDPGNAYLWKGAATGMVGVVEAEADATESFAFTETFNVRFPTKEVALSPAQASGDQIEIELAKRFVDRASWLFYEHTEANVIDY